MDRTAMSSPAINIQRPENAPEADYSRSVGGTIYGTTPGGSKFVYNRNELLYLRNSPMSKVSPLSHPAPPQMMGGGMNGPPTAFMPSRSPVSYGPPMMGGMQMGPVAPMYSRSPGRIYSGAEAAAAARSPQHLSTMNTPYEGLPKASPVLPVAPAPDIPHEDMFHLEP